MTDAAIAVVFAVFVTYVDRVFISGPYLGVAGVILSICAAIGGWYLAKQVKSLVALRTGTFGDAGYSMRPWAVIFATSSAVIFAALAYFILFDLTKVDYDLADVAYHLLLVLLAVFTIKIASFAIKNLTD